MAVAMLKSCNNQNIGNDICCVNLYVWVLRKFHMVFSTRQQIHCQIVLYEVITPTWPLLELWYKINRNIFGQTYEWIEFSNKQMRSEYQYIWQTKISD